MPSAPSPTLSLGRPLLPTPRPERFGPATFAEEDNFQQQFSTIPSPPLTATSIQSIQSAHHITRFPISDFDASMYNHNHDLSFPPSYDDACRQNNGPNQARHDTAAAPGPEYRFFPQSTRSASSSTVDTFMLPKPAPIAKAKPLRFLFFTRQQRSNSSESRHSRQQQQQQRRYQRQYSDQLQYQQQQNHQLNQQTKPLPRWLRNTRLTLRILAASGSILVIGLAAASLRIYNNSRGPQISRLAGENGFSPAWPVDVQLTSTVVLLLAAIFGLAHALGALMAVVLPKPRTRNQWEPQGARMFAAAASVASSGYCAAGVALIGVLLWFVAMVVFPIAGGERALAEVACRNRGSIDVAVVDYGAVCGEQVSFLFLFSLTEIWP